MSASTEQWAVFEVSLEGPSGGNPFVDVELSAEFSCGDRRVKVPGFYDGEGAYRVRFMPEAQGEWTYLTKSSAAELDAQRGAFICTAPAPSNHGPVRVRDTFHFAYADGTPYFSFGTTCYAWAHQGDALEEQTLETLKTAGFNKMRMCVFPKDYIFNKNEPVHYPFVKDADGISDFWRYDLEFFRHFEKRVAQLGELGIEADLILFHPYDRWGYAKMEEEQDYAYLRYIVARLAAYRHVWWSMANEYDFMLRDKPMQVWDRFFEIVRENDPYGHLRSIHNGRFEDSYDHTKEDVTHACVQHWDVKRMREWRAMYGKPVVDDECEYEGNIKRNWGNITARELVHRYWISICYGGYAGHGETYEHPENVLWWSKGGVLHGDSAPRLAFLRRIVEEGPGEGIEPLKGSFPWDRTAAGGCGNYRLIYFGEHQPKHFENGLPEEGRYEVDVIDTWNMTVEKMDGVFEGKGEIELPGRPHLAIRVRPVDGAGQRNTMKQSSVGEVRELYEDSADSYAAMMDAEIDLPIYAEVLGQLSAKLAARSGALIDTSCGSGHMLSMYRERYDSERPLLGIDLSPRMVEIASARFGGHAEILVGDMRDLSMVGTDSAAAIISFYSLHHLDPEGVSTALREWHRVLQPGGQLLVAAWEGTGVIDYGEASDVVALRYRSAELVAWARAAGFTVTQERVEPVEGMEMDAVFLQGAKA